MKKIIHQAISLPCDPFKAFFWFTRNNLLESWLTTIAEVEPIIGGKYELFWNPADRENDSTIGCKVTGIEPGQFISFNWKGPKKFKHFMNNVRPLTNVAIFLVPHPTGTEVHLLHTGWRDSAEWEEARQWFDKAWVKALSELDRKSVV